MRMLWHTTPTATRHPTELTTVIHTISRDAARINVVWREMKNEKTVIEKNAVTAMLSMKTMTIQPLNFFDPKLTPVSTKISTQMWLPASMDTSRKRRKHCLPVLVISLHLLLFEALLRAAASLAAPEITV
jgi:hypothetical protein